MSAQEQTAPGESGMPVRCRGSEEAEVTEGGNAGKLRQGMRLQSREPLPAAGSAD